MFDVRAAEGIEASYEFRLGEDRFRAEVADGWFEISCGGADHPDAIVETDAGTLAACFLGVSRLLEPAAPTGE